MYHGRFYGTHYEIGFKWGALLAQHGNFILNNIGFPITQERLEFSELCVPIYQEYLPEILDEIQGIADGQNCDVRTLQAFLFSMYAMPPSCNCSCFAVANDKQILFGRNSDFLTELEKSNMNVIYRLSSPSYSFTGNTTAFVQMEDGINEHGLAIGLTSIQPVSIKPGMNAGLLLRYFLEKCKTAQEVIECIHTLPISSAQTFTVADSLGVIAVIECCSENTAIIQPTDHKSYVCATNVFHLASMMKYTVADIDNWQAEPRYQTLVETLNQKAKYMDYDSAAELLSGKNGFICQYDRKTGKDTVWSVIYDLTNSKIYRTEGNPSRRKFKEDIRFHILK